MSLPALCDFAATSLGGIAFLYIPASVWLLLRSALIVFSAILSIVFLKRKLKVYHWIGMIVIVVGLSLVGLSALLSEHESQDNHFMDMVFGILLLMASLLIAAFQFTFEESLLKDRGFHALQVVGYEGLFGTIIMTILILPLLYFIPGPNLGSFENSLDALIQIKNSPSLLHVSSEQTVDLGQWMCQSAGWSKVAQRGVGEEKARRGEGEARRRRGEEKAR
jgi:drug/metabolite transporter (DMT)-like permease